MKSSGLLPAAALIAPLELGKTNAVTNLKSRIKLSVSSYSYWHFKGDKYPIEKVIDHAASLGLDGIDVLHRQMADRKSVV